MPKFYRLLLVVLYLSGVRGKIRNYYIAAVDQDWNYAPSGANLITDDTTTSDFYIKGGMDRIGGLYTKVIYREFTDGNFSLPITRPGWMGMLGPLMRAEVGDELHVHFRNLAYTSGRPFSIHPHGVLYTKANEGAIYLDGTSGANKRDDGVYPGETYTYVWKVTPEFGPSIEDPPCIPWGYHSHVHADKDIDSGLVGMLLTCQAGTLLDNGSRRDTSTEYVIYMDKTDENNSWMIKSNTERCGDPDLCLQKIADPDFVKSNEMWNINGFVYGNLPDLEVTVGQRVIWYIMSLNSGIQSVSFSGNTVTHRNHRLDTIPFLPSTFLSAEMIPAYVGNFLLYSRISENFAGGMQAFYTVKRPLPFTRQKRQATPSLSIPIGSKQQSRGWFPGNMWSSQNTRQSPTHMWSLPTNLNPSTWNSQGPWGVQNRQTPDKSSLLWDFLSSYISGNYPYSSSGVQNGWYPRWSSNNYYPQRSRGRLPQIPSSLFPKRTRNPGSWNTRSRRPPQRPPHRPPPAVSKVPGQRPSPQRPIPSDKRPPNPLVPSEIIPAKVTPIQRITTFPTTPIPIPPSTKIPYVTPRPSRKGPRRPPHFRNAWKRPGISIYTRNVRGNAWQQVPSKLNFTHSPEPNNTFKLVDGQNNNTRNDRGNAWQHIPSKLSTTHSSNVNNTFKLVDEKINKPRNIGTTSAPESFAWTTISTVTSPDSTTTDWTASSRAPRKSRSAQFGPGLFNSFQNYRARVYYLSIERVLWNYGPSGFDKFNGGGLLNNTKSKPFFERGPQRIGGEYVKVQFFQYTDERFTERVETDRRYRHLGLLGPPILAEVGDDVTIVLRNNGDVPFSFLPYGFTFAKSQEGLIYKDKQTGEMTGRVTQPNQTMSYYFSVPDVYAGPTADDAPCVTHTYQSGVNPVKDMNSGLVGPIVICRRGQLQQNVLSPLHRQSWFSSNKHIYLALITFDENESWYLDENIRRYTTSPELVDKQDADFKESNAIHSINGLVYGNLKGIDFCLSENVIWHLMVFGGTTDMHGLYIHGQTWDEFGNNIDSKGLLPGFTATMTSKPDTVGTWGIVCRTNSHFEGGMVALYTVEECGNEERMLRRGPSRKYFIAAIEVEWDYAPLKRSLADGEPLTDINQPGGVFVVNSDMYIGSKYKKVIYREFTDETFTTPVIRGLDEEHLEIMGPFIKAEVGENIEVVFKNLATMPYSIHAQGLKYSKANEGSKYADESQEIPSGRSVPPGRTFTYHWEVPARAGPGRNDPNCIGRMYYSAVDSVVDTYSGLFGPLVVCRSGILDSTGRRMDVDREFAVMFMVVDENRSHYLNDNIQLYAPMVANMKLDIPKSHINGNMMSPRTKLNETNDVSSNNMGRQSGINHKSESEDPLYMQVRPDGNSHHHAFNHDSMVNDINNDKLFDEINDHENVLHKRSIKDVFQTRHVDSKTGGFQNPNSDSSNNISTPEHFPNPNSNKTDSQNRVARDITNNIETPQVNAGVKTVAKTIVQGRDPALFGTAMFQHSNHMNSINGRLMGNLKGIEMNQGDKVAWYVLALGSAEDYHPVHIHGQVFTRRSDRAHGSDVVEVFPSTSDTVEMLAVNPGDWILHCHFSKHAKNGMQLIYTVYPKK
ncbi:hypothetical protein SNE40_015034 [Patella caerulea]|uniref:Uncharacterized protein n=1 Tax=Patella caerulea TaxID=87958 RepID=A0AAN8PDZ8_PATCE